MRFLEELKKLVNYKRSNSDYYGGYYYGSRDYYYESINFAENPFELQNIFDLSQREHKHTSAEIRFNNVEFGQSSKDVIKILGRPKFVSSDSLKFPGHSVLFYRYHLLGTKTIAQLHFLHDRFVLGTYLFRSALNEDEINIIESVLLNKYLGSDETLADWQVITDDSKNAIKIEDSAQYMIHYVSGEQKIRDSIKRFIMVQRKEEQLKRERRLKELEDLL